MNAPQWDHFMLVTRCGGDFDNVPTACGRTLPMDPAPPAGTPHCPGCTDALERDPSLVSL